MAKGFNKVTLLGNLTRDPELRNTQNGNSVCNFSLAVNRTWRNAEGEQQEAVDFIDCAAWGKAGELIEQYTQKGRPLLVSGRLRQSSWEQEDGSKRSKLEVVVEDFNFIGGPGDDGAGTSADTQGNTEEKSSGKSSQSKSQSDQDVEIEDLDDDVDLSEVPF